MNHTLHRTMTALAATVLAASAGMAGAPAANAHPLGNFTVNYHTGLTLHRDRIDARIVVDRAEISALQERSLVDTDHDGSITSTESSSYARTSCSVLGRQLQVKAEDRDTNWRPTSAALGYQPGEAGLRTSRLTCELTADAALTEPADITVRTGYDTRRIGWREITATALDVKITHSDVPAVSATQELRQYPQDPLASPLDEQTARVSTAPGHSAGLAPAATDIPGAGLATRLLAKVAGVFDSLVGAREITFPVGLLALFLALVLGASHAAMPGHGKTIMAAYLAGRRGTRRDAATVGATVTLTHTAGVLVLGLALPTATHLAGETVLVWLGAASGLLVTGIGLWLLTGALRGKSRHNHHHHGPHDHGPHDHTHDHDHGHDHHVHVHDHDGGHTHEQDPSLDSGTLIPARRTAGTPQPNRSVSVASVATLAPAHPAHPAAHMVTPPAPAPVRAPVPKTGRRQGKAGLIGMGIAGGLVPSPSALVVLLGAVALGRTAFGVLLVIGYGLGMATTLTLAGLLLVRVRERIETHRSTHALRDNTFLRGLRGLARTGPVLTSLLVVAVGFGLTLRAVMGSR